MSVYTEAAIASASSASCASFSAITVASQPSRRGLPLLPKLFPPQFSSAASALGKRRSSRHYIVNDNYRRAFHPRGSNNPKRVAHVDNAFFARETHLGVSCFPALEYFCDFQPPRKTLHRVACNQFGLVEARARRACSNEAEPALPQFVRRRGVQQVARSRRPAFVRGSESQELSGHTPGGGSVPAALRRTRQKTRRDRTRARTHGNHGSGRRSSAVATAAAIRRTEGIVEHESARSNRGNPDKLEAGRCWC